MAVITGKDIYQFMDRFAPFDTQEDWDNAGFLVGRLEREVKKVMVAMDITEQVAQEAGAWGAELIISHHPVILHESLNKVTDETVTGRILLALTERGISAICAHTNLDAAEGGVNTLLAQALGLSGLELLQKAGTDRFGRPYGIGRVGTAGQSGLSAGEYAALIKETLGCANVRYADAGRPVHRVAVGGGSCGSLMEEAIAARCDTFVTADLKHAHYLTALAQGMNILDAGHFPTENLVCEPLAQRLRQEFPQLQVMVSQLHREPYASV